LRRRRSAAAIGVRAGRRPRDAARTCATGCTSSCGAARAHRASARTCRSDARPGFGCARAGCCCCRGGRRGGTGSAAHGAFVADHVVTHVIRGAAAPSPCDEADHAQAIRPTTVRRHCLKLPGKCAPTISTSGVDALAPGAGRRHRHQITSLTLKRGATSQATGAAAGSSCPCGPRNTAPACRLQLQSCPVARSPRGRRRRARRRCPVRRTRCSSRRRDRG
jgi:hypothetical protein